MEKIKINVFKDNEKTRLAYEELHKKLTGIIKMFQLDYFEVYGILKAIDIDLIQTNLQEEED